MVRGEIAAAVVLLIVCSGSWAIAQSSTGNVKRGQDIYGLLCLRCHGENLDGQGPEADSLGVQPANLAALSSQVKDDGQLMVIIANGVMFMPMHGYRDLLYEEEIRDVLSYIRTVAPARTDEPKP